MLVFEYVFVEKVGIGWMGKYSLILNKDVGLWFFLGELFINLFLLIDVLVEFVCGMCNVCMMMCLMNVIVVLYIVDVKCCIFYLIIELDDDILEVFRFLMGN